jgi:signal transduction histidine kinase
VDAAAEVTTQLVHALGEMLHNIDKHARATTVDVVLTGDARLIALEVTDNGIGFDVARSAERERAGHFGLRGLSERAHQVGGSVQIDSTRGKGTRIRWTALRHPLHP